MTDLSDLILADARLRALSQDATQAIHPKPLKFETTEDGSYAALRFERDAITVVVASELYDEELAYAIAHELCHVIEYASGQTLLADQKTLHPTTARVLIAIASIREHHRIHARMRSFGFDVSAEMAIFQKQTVERTEELPTMIALFPELTKDEPIKLFARQIESATSYCENEAQAEQAIALIEEDLRGGVVRVAEIARDMVTFPDDYTAYLAMASALAIADSRTRQILTQGSHREKYGWA